MPGGRGKSFCQGKCALFHVVAKKKQTEETFIQKVVVQMEPAVRPVVFGNHYPAGTVVFRGRPTDHSPDVDSLDGERLGKTVSPVHQRLAPAE